MTSGCLWASFRKRVAKVHCDGLFCSWDDAKDRSESELCRETLYTSGLLYVLGRAILLHCSNDAVAITGESCSRVHSLQDCSTL